MEKKTWIYMATAVFLVLYTFSFAQGWIRAVRVQEERFLPVDSSEKGAALSEKRIFLDSDVLYWISYAEQMLETGTWRIRHCRFDNPPDGRPVHWSQSVSWLLISLAALRNLVTHAGLAASIEPVSVWAGPLLNCIFLIFTGGLIFRRLGALSSCIWMISAAALPSVEWSFNTLRLDHHGFQMIFTIGSMLFLLFSGYGISEKAESSSPQGRKGRLFFVLSGVMGGLGFWIGATEQLAMLGLLAVGSVLVIGLSWRRDRKNEPVAVDPVGWRLWAWCGAAVSLLFYMVEFAPHFPGMRMEVNHPIYALCWIAVGEFLFQLATMRKNGRLTVPGGLVLGLSALIAGGVVAAVLFGPAEWYALRMPMMYRLHLFIDEFTPIVRHAQGHLFSYLIRSFGLLPLFLAGSFFVWRRFRDDEHLYAFVHAILIATAYLALGLFMQSRWMSAFTPAALLVMVLFAHRFMQSSRIATRLFFVVFIVQAVWLMSIDVAAFVRLQKEPKVDPVIMRKILDRQLFEKMAVLAEEEQTEFRVMCDPGMAGRLHYYGGGSSFASYYWDNPVGLQDAVTFFATDNMDDARRVAARRGVTHVLLNPGPDTAYQYYYIKHGHHDDRGAQQTFAGRMVIRPRSLPSWIQRDEQLEKRLQPGYLFAGQLHVAQPYMLFRVDPSGSSYNSMDGNH